jgi:hypothetical protein
MAALSRSIGGDFKRQPAICQSPDDIWKPDRLVKKSLEPIPNRENGFIKDRRLRADGFIIRAQAMIRTDGFFVRAGLASACALRAPTPLVLYGYTPSV